MKRIAISILAALLAACAVDAPTAAPPPVTQAVVTAPVYIIRHLQKGEGPDPSLTAEGSANAERLAAMLKDKGIVALFATPTKRAMETAEPLARQIGMTVKHYDPGNPDALVAAVAAAPGPVLIVGHSNTVPDLVAKFGGAAPAPLSDGDYGTLFAVAPDGTVTRIEVR